MATYLYQGNARLIGAVEFRLTDAGYVRTEDAQDAEVVFTYCMSQSELEEVYFGDSGLVMALKPGSLIIDLSPSTPTFSRELGAVAAVNDIAMAEAPLVVTNPLSEQAFHRDNLACFISAEDDACERAQKVLDVFIGTTHVMPGLGSAQLARASLTLQMAAQAVAAIESAALFKASRSALGTQDFETVYPGAVTPYASWVIDAVEGKHFEGDFTIEMAMGELAAALMSADDAELILPQAEATMNLLELLAVIGGADKNLASLSLVYGEESEGEQYGLDWNRAQEAYATHDDEHHHDDDEDDDFDDFDDDDDEFEGGFGFGYSSN